MKLIIDIHEEQYDFIKQGMSIDKVVQFPALMEAICEHIMNGIPLDDVKAEIKELRDSWEKDCYHDEAEALGIALKIIDKHIGKGDKE